MTDTRKVKIITTGPILGCFHALQVRLQNLQTSKAGPFDLCLCAGPFFSQSTSLHETQILLRDGMPIPVYFCHIGELPPELPFDETQRLLNHSTYGDASQLQDKGYRCISNNVFHLCGKIVNQHIAQTADIINLYVDQSLYLTVGFLPPNVSIGTDQCSPFEEKATHPSYIGCDILISSDWGQGMASSSAISDQDKGVLLGSSFIPESNSHTLSNLGSYDVGELVAKARPRYHYSPTIYAGSIDANNSLSDSLFFIQSLPYVNPPSALSSGLRKQYHVSRFLALCPLIADKKEGVINGKMFKSMHALGLQPLWSMDIATANAMPEGSIVQSPYTDLAYAKDIDSSGKKVTNASVGLSEAQARRIISEVSNTAASSIEEQQYRWDVRNTGKRPFKDTHSLQDAGSEDPNNYTLFLHGILADSSSGSPLTQTEITQYFQKLGCTHVRYPSATSNLGKPKSFCFLDFSSHEKAKTCLESCNGTVSIHGVTLSLRWSSGKSAGATTPSGMPPYPPPLTLPFPKSYKRPRLSEADAADSESLFVFLPFKPASSSDNYSRLLNIISEAAQTLMENAMNDVGNAMDGTSKITAETEPALRVTSRYPSANNNYGFLDFASHAAASVVLATLTGSIEGGDLLVDEMKVVDSIAEDLNGIQIWWAMGKNKENEPKRDYRARHNLQSHHFPLDARTDCWFCLASPTCEPHLIINVYDTCYITMPKGPCNDFHALIVPVLHMGGNATNANIEDAVEGVTETQGRPSYFDNLGVYSYSDPLVLKDVHLVKEKLWKHTDQGLGKDLFFFERAFSTYRGYHPHINCVPIDRGTGPLVISIMLEMAKNCSERFQFVQIFVPVNEEIARRKNNGDNILGYFYAEILSSENQSQCFVFIDIEKHDKPEPTNQFQQTSVSADSMNPEKVRIPLQFGRQVIAKTVGDPSLAFWKHCVYSKEKEEELTNAYRQSFLLFE